MQTFWKTINISLLVAILAIGLLLVGTMIPIPGNFKVKIVKSGSMEPVIRTGGIVIIKPEAAYHVGDIVTFGADTKTQIPTTHRIIEIGDSPLGQSIRTKGDANNAPDAHATPMSEVHGKVILTIPYIGYLLDFARKPLGFALLVGLPALAVIIDEVGKIITEIKRLRKKKNGEKGGGSGSTVEQHASALIVEEKDKPRSKPTPVGLAPWPTKKSAPPSSVRMEAMRVTLPNKRATLRLQAFLALLLPLASVVALSTVGNTVSYFSDVEAAIGNTLKADPLGFSVALASSSQINMQSGGAVATPSFIPSADSEPIQYSVSAYMTGGDTTLCGLVTMDASTSLGYSGPLLLLTTGMTTTTGALPIVFSLPQGYAANENTSCFVDLIFSGRNQGAAQGEGYNYTVHLPLQFFVPASIFAPTPIQAGDVSAPVPAVGDATTSTLDISATSTDAAESTSTPIDIAPTSSIGASTTPAQESAPTSTESEPTDTTPPSTTDAVNPPLDTPLPPQV